jgi:hypothetical protein
MQNHQLDKFQDSVLLSPPANQEEVRNTLDGWFSDDMPDMNQDEPEVACYEIQNSLWWVGMTGIDGIRQDTIQYAPRFFIRDLENALHRQYPRMWMVGEVFERDGRKLLFSSAGTRVGTALIQSWIQTSISRFRMSRWTCSRTNGRCAPCAINCSSNERKIKIPVSVLRFSDKAQLVAAAVSKGSVSINNELIVPPKTGGCVHAPVKNNNR